MEAKITTFVATHRALADSASAQSGCQPSIILAQWALESDWGESDIAQQNLNLAGIRASGFQAHLRRYESYPSLELFAQGYAALLKRDCPGLATEPQTPLTVFSGSDWATNAAYAQEVDAVWTYDILPALALLDAPPVAEPTPPAQESPESNPNEPEQNEAPDLEPSSDLTPPAPEISPPTQTPPRTLIVSVPADPAALAEQDRWDIPVTLLGPTGIGWSGSATVDTGSFETLLPGVAGGIGTMLGLPNLGAEGIGGVSGGAEVWKSTVDIRLTDPQGQGLLLQGSPCVVDPTADLLLLGAAGFITRGVTVELDPVAKVVNFYTGG